MNKHLRILLSVLSGLVAGVASFALIVVLANASIIWTFTHGHPNDPSAGDSAGWAFVFLSPVILAVGMGVSAAVGLLTYSFARTRLRTPDQAGR
jgi:hypothetical protein